MLCKGFIDLGQWKKGGGHETYHLKAENFIESHTFFPSPPRATLS